MKTLLLLLPLILAGCATPLADFHAMCSGAVQSYAESGDYLKVECK